MFSRANGSDSAEMKAWKENEVRNELTVVSRSRGSRARALALNPVWTFNIADLDRAARSFKLSCCRTVILDSTASGAPRLCLESCYLWYALDTNLITPPICASGTQQSFHSIPVIMSCTGVRPSFRRLLKEAAKTQTVPSFLVPAFSTPQQRHFTTAQPRRSRVGNAPIAVPSEVSLRFFDLPKTNARSRKLDTPTTAPGGQRSLGRADSSHTAVCLHQARRRRHQDRAFRW